MHEIFDNMKNSTARVKKTDLEALSRKVDKLHINETSTRCNITHKLVPPYDADGTSFQELQTSLHKIEGLPMQPFTFLADIRQVFASEDQFMTEAKDPTEIDIQLAAATKRIKSSKTLLEEAKSYVDEMRCHIRQNNAKIRQASEIHAYHDGELK